MTNSQRANIKTNTHAMETVLSTKGLLQNILSFVADTYRFTAAVNRLFHQTYLETHNHENRHRTLFRNALQAIGTARIWVVEIPTVLSVSALHRGVALAVCDWVAIYGTLTVLQDLRANGYSWSVCTCINAAKRGDLDMLIWAREQGCLWIPKIVCNSAAGLGHLPMMMWARDHGCPWDAQTCASAAQRGQLVALQWLRQRGCSWDAQTCADAAGGGYLEILIWARDNGCPWNGKTCAWAARKGHWNVLIWARDHGCPWDEETCESAVIGGHLNVLEWARDHGCPWDVTACIEAAPNNDIRNWIAQRALV